MKRLTQLAIAVAVAAGLSQTVIAQAQSLSKYDRIKAAVQKICPVTGKPLGSMGDPPKVKIGEEEIFLCCKGCAKGQINKEHWLTIHANFANAQGTCPVMEKALPANPKSTVVNGQTIYICCPPCTKKIQADPTKYLTKLAGFYQVALEEASTTRRENDSSKKPIVRSSSRNNLRMAVQRICPVSGNILGSMGSPFKVKADGMDVFLCCEGCKEGKIERQHWKMIRDNIKSAQVKCPVMEKELPVNAKSTVVDGQLVFVCCPQCTKKIDQDPAKYLAKIDEYYVISVSKNKTEVVR